ncbi:hypothetical protein A2982_02365 [candidate division WWE3 bacterium RIFCSPLOWO2_01_FULL_39_13]|uniref:PilN domain-containing protein n=1 Tax=candidate division WWE3 bacterium RIFCSPLOWO2_01_FULL_39_13 TaxID=1802624 RepID=A0A1F4V1P4_UNCKA|nr:MAG: hypothetical protein A2982_02365 [candidate division WWE3 bacterium RIFCSPLOWO2_01_FULL_39_13]
MPASLTSGINFIPDDVVESKTREGYKKRGFLVGLVIVGLFVVAGAGIFIYNKTLEAQLSRIQQDISEKQGEITRLIPAGESGYVLGTRLEEIEFLLNDRRYYSKLMDLLKRTTPETVNLTDWNVSENTLTLTGTTPSTYSPIAEFKENLLNDKSDDPQIIKEVLFENAALNKEDKIITFTLKIDLSPEGLKESIK